MTTRQSRRRKRYHGMANNLAIDAIIALIGAIVIVSPFILLLYRVI
jgi:hypothetical protein